MDGELTWRQLLLEQLKQHIQKARDHGKCLQRRDQNIWVSAAELEAQIAEGKFIWDVDTWVIADPMANIDYLRRRVSEAQQDLDRFRQRFALS
jgi:hypothetical protein